MASVRPIPISLLSLLSGRAAVAGVVLYGIVVCVTAASGTPEQPVPPAPILNLLDKPLGEDGFYMLSVARSLADGGGLSYGSVPTTGVQPLATVVYAGVYWLANFLSLGDDAALRGVIFLNVTLLVAVGLLSGRLVHQQLADAGMDAAEAMWLVPTLVVVNAAAFRLFTYGLETGVYLLCIVLVQLAVLHQRRALVIGILSGGCFLARVDFAIVAIVVVGIFFLRGRFTARDVAIMVLAAAVVALPWVWRVFQVTGGMMPSSGASQAAVVATVPELLHRSWVLLSSAIIAGTAVLYLPLIESPLQRLVVCALALVLAAGGWTIRRELRAAWPHYWPWLVGAGVVAGYYWLTSYAVHFYPRYMAPLWLVWLQMLGAALAIVATRRRVTPAVRSAFNASLAALFAVQIGYTLHRGAAGNSHLFTGFYIQREQPSLGIVAAFQSGVVGYMTRERTINLDGKLDGRALAWRDARRLECYLAERGVTTLIDWDANIRNGWIDPAFVNRRMHEIDRVEGGASIVMRVDAIGLQCPSNP